MVWNEVTSAAMRDVAAEPRRQVEVEGWTFEHDDAHSAGEIARAALCYLFAAVWFVPDGGEFRPVWWPWDWSWWKPGTARRMMVKAAALIVAEIERRDRMEAACG